MGHMTISKLFLKSRKIKQKKTRKNTKKKKKKENNHYIIKFQHGLDGPP